MAGARTSNGSMNDSRVPRHILLKEVPRMKRQIGRSMCDLWIATGPLESDKRIGSSSQKVGEMK